MEENKTPFDGNENEILPKDPELPVVADAPTPPEDPEKIVYRWDYGEYNNEAEISKKKKGKNAATVYAVAMTCAFAVCFVLLIVTLLTGNFSSFYSPIQNNNAPTAERVVYVKEYDPSSGVLTDQEIYDTCSPAIVSISVTSTESSSMGSGFIISEDGYIATANHVVSGNTSINVILSNGSEYPATIVNGNEFTDLAIIKINAKDLPYLSFGSSSELMVGDRVVAIGTPASTDFAGSLVNGIVSYNNREFKLYDENNVLEKKMTLIQTNALVNPGNSGCPLINQYGKVVGIVTLKLNSTYYEGMCFAIPSDAAAPILLAMKDGKDYSNLLGKVSKLPAKIGITGQTYVDGNTAAGIKIIEISSDKFDAAKKLQSGDVIVAIDGKEVATINQLVRYLDQYEPGDTVNITFYRNGQRMTVNILLAS